MTSALSRLVTAALLVTAKSFTLQAGTIAIASVNGYVHSHAGLEAVLNSSSPTYFSTLNANNEGAFGWSFTNLTGATLQNVWFFGFVDADIDRATNTFFNEYGQFIGLALPVSAPPGAIPASSWEIDEPGFLFGDIINNLLSGALDNTNAVPSSGPDDVSLALGFLIGALGPNQTTTLTLEISSLDIGGLSQIDPGSLAQFYFNGFAIFGQGSIPPNPSPTPPPTSPTPEVPEPGTLGMVGIALGAAALCRHRLRDL